WQPVLSGELYWRQFKRLEVAARALENHAGAPEKEAHQMTDDASMIEIAGYRISPALIAGLSASHLVLPANTRRV
ncbi:MAG TPA: hydrolase 2, exosortase A system-associated, partial [Betaproteobacteria bacterium]|nr:hydrolase 2, exosortase A system-associated [Betaproteobacteria bacterium]